MGDASFRPIGLYYYRARYYSPKHGRFLQTDPVGTKDDQNLYVYTFNNPTNGSDPLGSEVVLADPADKAQVEQMINSRALGRFEFDANQKLQLTSASGDSANYSAYYQSKLVEVIGDTNTISIDVSQTYTSASGATLDVDLNAGGGVTSLDRKGDSRVTVSGNAFAGLKDVSGAALRDEAPDILGHELLGHAIPGAVGPDTGNAIDNENKMRSEVKGGGQRAPDPGHTECGQRPCRK